MSTIAVHHNGKYEYTFETRGQANEYINNRLYQWQLIGDDPKKHNYSLYIGKELQFETSPQNN